MSTTNGACSGVIRRGNIIYGPTKNYEPLDGGLGRFIFEACDKFNDQIMQICGETGKSETFSSFKTRSRNVAVEMKRRGISKKDVIVICTPNALDGSLVPAAALYLGAATASLDRSLSLKDTTQLLSLVEPKIIFVHENSVELIENALQNNEETDVEVVVFGSSDKYSTFDEFLVDANEDFVPIYLDDDEVSFIMFSSGSTGLPKGIMLTHKSIYLGSKVFCDISDHGTCLIHFSSFYWVSGILMFLSQFCDGAKRVLANTFSVENAFEIIEKYQVSTTFLASSYVHKISNMKTIDKYDTSSLKFITFGGGPVAKEQLIKVKKMLPHTYCTIGYGMTEVCFASNFMANEKELAEININSCGRPAYNTILKIVDLETEKPVGVNKSGEIRLKTSALMAGYYKQDSSENFDSEGYIKTGDIGHFNEDCCIYVHDRIKEMFKYQSWHIVPASIEGVIKEHPDVVEVVVFGIPSEEDGHIPAAAVTLSPAANVTEKDIADFVAERVIDRQTLRGGVYFMDEMPKTPSDKINRKKIQALILEKIQCNL